MMDIPMHNAISTYRWSWLYLCTLCTAFKLLLLPSYKSTDFEVHRNWLAITNSLPFSQWYYENTSQWTLDYPPFFAWFEYVLSGMAGYFDKNMLAISSEPYNSDNTTLFQRLSVITTDFLYFFGAFKCGKIMLLQSEKNTVDIKNGVKASERSLWLLLLLLFNYGLFLVDHIHFQYNGMLFGLLLLSVASILKGKILFSAFWFTVLLNFKHIFIYMAPAYGIFMFKKYCFETDGGSSELVDLFRRFSPIRLMKLAFVVISVTAISFGPFIYLGQLSQVLLRLFPFKRGLTHAYWAPNAWALYNTVDKTATVGAKLGLISVPMNTSSAVLTGGLVQETQHVVLPTVSPHHTAVLTMVALLPYVYLLWTSPRTTSHLFVQSLAGCSLSAYMWGWHVHEKAILMVIIPLSLLAVHHRRDARLFVLLSTVGHYSLFPLLFTSAEWPTKVLGWVMYTGVVWVMVHRLHGGGVCRWWEVVYLSGVVPLEVVCVTAPHVVPHLPFLPLMLTSVYCSLGVTYCWLMSYWIVYQTKLDLKHHNKTKML